MWAILATNGLIIGLAALSMVQGPYSSWGQELWYRYGSLGFLLGGAIIPALALLLGASRSRTMMGALAAWMAATLVAFCCFAIMSGGGV